MTHALVNCCISSCIAHCDCSANMIFLFSSRTAEQKSNSFMSLVLYTYTKLIEPSLLQSLSTNWFHHQDSFSIFSSSCYSRLGRTGRKQKISLAAGCWVKGIVIHEIGTHISTVIPMHMHNVFNCFSMISQLWFQTDFSKKSFLTPTA